jgi:type III secretion system FlhB-like substrate exporter
MMEKNYKKAIALKYSIEDDKLTSKLETNEILADRILKDVVDGVNPIYKDLELIKKLSSIELGEGIQEDIFPIAYKIISFIELIDEKYFLANSSKNN